MEVVTLAVARSFGWRVHMRCANGYRLETRSMRRCVQTPFIREGLKYNGGHGHGCKQVALHTARLSGRLFTRVAV